MHPKIWGDPAWIFLECVGLHYPENPTEEDKRNMWVFLNSLQPILPCDDCQGNYKKHLKKLPLTDEILSSKDNLVMWLIDQRNLVNEEKGTKIYSHDEAIIEIEKMISNRMDGKSNQVIEKPIQTVVSKKDIGIRDKTYLPYCVIVVLIVIILIMGFFLYTGYVSGF